MKKYKKQILISIAAIVVLNLLLLITNNGFLIYEKHIKEARIMDTNKKLKIPEEMQTYHCRYWTGRSVVVQEFYVSAVPQCPFIYKLQGN